MDLPDLDQRWTTSPDCRQQFAAVLASVGGRCVFVQDLSQLNQALVDLPPYAAASSSAMPRPNSIFNAEVDALPSYSNCFPNTSSDFCWMPHRLSKVVRYFA